MADASTSGASRNSLTLTTFRNWLPKMADNITEGPTLLKYYKDKKLFDKEELVGSEDVIKIDREDNANNIQWFDGADEATVQPTEGLIDSYVGHFNIRATMQMTDVERLENAGRAKHLSRFKVRMRALERGLKKTISQALVGTRGSNTRLPEGLRDLFGGAAPESSIDTANSFQNLSSSTYDWWKPYIESIDSLGANNHRIRDLLLSIWMELQKVDAKPSVGICDQIFFEQYLKSVGGSAIAPGFATPNVRTYSGDRPTGTLDLAGPMKIAWNGVPIYFDGDIAVPSTDYTSTTAGHVCFIDENLYSIVFDPRWYFKLFAPRKRSGNDRQWVDVYAVAVRMTTRCWARRAHAMGVLDI